MPTQEEIDGLTLADFSDRDNVRKLARIIAAKNSMEQAAVLTAELSYAYQCLTYDTESIAMSLDGVGSPENYTEAIEALERLSEPRHWLIGLLIGALETAKERAV
jgi:hypothetical protein